MRRLLLALGAVSLLACGDSSGPEAASAVGRWTLVTVNGAQLPVVIDQQTAPPYTLELLRDEFDIRPDGTFDQITDLRENDNGTISIFTIPDAGMWTQNNSASRLTFDSDGSSITIAISGNSASYSAPGVVAVYQRL